MYSFQVSDSNIRNKKLKVIIYKDGIKKKTLHIGDNRYGDYITYYPLNPNWANNKKELYLLRHKNEDWNDFMKPAYWAKNLLWNKSTLEASIKSITLE